MTSEYVDVGESPKAVLDVYMLLMTGAVMYACTCFY